MAAAGFEPMTQEKVNRNVVLVLGADSKGMVNEFRTALEQGLGCNTIVSVFPALFIYL